MKQCTACKQLKSESEFSLRSKIKGNLKLKSWCKSCIKKYDNTSYSSSETRRKSLRKAAKASSERCKAHIQKIKAGGKCQKCGDARPYVLDFHHLRDKKFVIGEAVRRGLSIKKLQIEIDKCILLCANCHRELHHINSDIYPRPDTT